MILTFGKFRLDVDIDKTREYYNTVRLITEGCDCDGCANFEQATELFPNPVKKLFGDLGIDPKKAAEVFTCCAEDNGTKMHYTGCYVFFGKILSGERIMLFEKVDENTSIGTLQKKNLFKVDEGYSVGFESDGDDITLLFMQVYFDVVPWVLNKPNKYK